MDPALAIGVISLVFDVFDNSVKRQFVNPYNGTAFKQLTITSLQVSFFYGGHA